LEFTSVVNGKTSLSEIAYNKLKSLILHLTLRPGDPITELDLIETLGMSRTPIRQALNRLAQEGFVSLLPRKGWYVTEISLRDIHEIFIVREALEGMAARIAAEIITDTALTELNQYMAAIEIDEKSETDPGDKIHEKILAIANNQRINGVLQLYEDHLKRFHYVAIRLPGRVTQSYKEHKEIIEAINDKNSDLAEATMRKHIQSSRKSLFDSIAAGRVVW